MPVGWGACMCACEFLKSPVAHSIIPGKPCSSYGRGGTCEVTEIIFATATYGGIRATSSVPISSYLANAPTHFTIIIRVCGFSFLFSEAPGIKLVQVQKFKREARALQVTIKNVR